MWRLLFAVGAVLVSLAIWLGAHSQLSSERLPLPPAGRGLVERNLPKESFRQAGDLEFMPETIESSDPISDILSTAPNEGEAARRLLQAAPSVAVSRQPELFSHVMNLLDDEGFEMVRPILLEARTSKETLDVIYGELLNRPDAVKLPLLIELATQPRHPLCAESRETLSLLFGEDFGSDREAWNKRIAKELEAARDSR